MEGGNGERAFDAGITGFAEDFQDLCLAFAILDRMFVNLAVDVSCLLYTSPSPRD